MSISVRSRIGATVLAAAVIAGGLFAAAPANAATADLEVANTVYTESDWGTGLDVSGTGYQPNATVTVSIVLNGSILDSTTAATDNSGEFTLAGWSPAASPVLSTETATTMVTATDGLGTTTEGVALSIRRAAGIVSNVGTISTADLVNPAAGLAIVASGYLPGESVTITATYNGQNVLESTGSADASGTVQTGGYLVSGVAEAGRITFTVTSATHLETITIEVTGDSTAANGSDAGDSTSGAGGGTGPSLGASPAASAKDGKLPVVSG